MTLYSDIWRLPGPSRFIQEAARLAGAGQHVLLVVPKRIAENDEYTDALVVTLAAELDDCRRVYPGPSHAGLAGAIGFELSSDFDAYPTTVPDLLISEDFAGRVAVCRSADLDAEHLQELPRFLARLDTESRSVPASQRGTMVFVVSQDLLPADADSPATARLWFWNRIARWDVAALLASRHPPREAGDIAEEVRLETIVELVRWDLELALEVASEWAATEPIEAALSKIPKLDGTQLTTRRASGRPQPPEALLDYWNDGILESWHGEVGYMPAALPHTNDRLERLTWSAQARVLLPWIEVRRVRIEQIVRQKLGPTKFNSAVEALATRYPGSVEDTSIIEVALLARIIAVRFGNTEPRLRSTAISLRDARNKLAHLVPIAAPTLTQMVAESSWLDG